MHFVKPEAKLNFKYVKAKVLNLYDALTLRELQAHLFFSNIFWTSFSNGLI